MSPGTYNVESRRCGDEYDTLILSGGTIVGFVRDFGQGAIGRIAGRVLSDLTTGQPGTLLEPLGGGQRQLVIGA